MTEKLPICNRLQSPRFLHNIESASVYSQIGDFDPEKHLTSREKKDCLKNLTSHGIFLIRETDDGWWVESIDFKGDV